MATMLASIPSLTVVTLGSGRALTWASLHSHLKYGGQSRNILRGVRCDARQDPIGAIKEAVRRTKVDISEEDVAKNMEREDEKAAVFGTKPVEGTTLPRPESERRPELGNVDLGSIMAFDGPGPETMNGRLAMTGFLVAVIAEAISHKTIMQQLLPDQPGLFWVASLTQIIIFASLVPILKGESPDSRRNGPFNGKAERWNGRLAMVGFAGIIIFEAVSSRPFLQPIWPIGMLI